MQAHIVTFPCSFRESSLFLGTKFTYKKAHVYEQLAQSSYVATNIRPEVEPATSRTRAWLPNRCATKPHPVKYRLSWYTQCTDDRTKLRHRPGCDVIESDDVIIWCSPSKCMQCFRHRPAARTYCCCCWARRRHRDVIAEQPVAGCSSRKSSSAGVAVPLSISQQRGRRLDQHISGSIIISVFVIINKQAYCMHWPLQPVKNSRRSWAVSGHSHVLLLSASQPRRRRLDHHVIVISIIIAIVNNSSSSRVQLLGGESTAWSDRHRHSSVQSLQRHWREASRRPTASNWSDDFIFTRDSRMLRAS